jgi:hypothetical protein
MIHREEPLPDDVVDESDGLVCTRRRHLAAVYSELIDSEYPLQSVVFPSGSPKHSYVFSPRLSRPTRSILTSQYLFQTVESPFDIRLRRICRSLPPEFDEFIASS